MYYGLQILIILKSSLVSECQTGNLKILPRKGDLSNTNDWREINLLDVTSKVISIVITCRFQSALTIDGIPFQFGLSPNTGFPDGSQSIKSILQLNEEHDLDTLVVFVDIIKAFDTIYHKLIFKLFSKFGIPKYLIKVIEKLYHKFQIEIKVGKCKEKIDYKTGVKQGDNLAPILFIIVMQFIYELVGKKFKECKISKINFTMTLTLITMEDKYCGKSFKTR